MNVHPTATWAEAQAALEGPAAAVKEALAPATAFAAGLRFSAAALAELEAPAARAELGSILDACGFAPVTMNSFPYGPFHGTRVKEEVYLPDWRSEARLDYTLRLAALMAEIAPGRVPPGEPLSLSTVPGAFRPNGEGAEAEMLRTVAGLASLRERTGVEIALAIEPEPCCFLETIKETVRFFDRWLFGEAALRRMAELADLTTGEAAAALPRHLGLCYDVCHAAVEFEDPTASLAALRSAGVPVHKLQLSPALRLPRATAPAREALRAFDEPVYLHQVVSRRPDGSLRRESDLAQPLARGAEGDAEEWRVHFHVPLFVAEVGPFETTQDFLAEILAIHRRAPISRHLEVETYTWDVLPPELRAESVEASVIRELRWVLERL